MTQATGPQGARKSRWSRWGRWLLAMPVLVMLATVLQVLVLRWVDPPFSAFMAARQIEAWRAGDRDFRPSSEWRAFGAIAPELPLAVIASEDQTFSRHHGFDLQAIEKARAHNARGRSRGTGSWQSAG